MDGSIRFGMLLPTGKAQWGEGTEPRVLIDCADRAVALGYASVWANDSVLSPRIETLVMLATVAPLTTRVTLGTATLLPVLRRPVQAAQALASLDLLTGGRLAVGVGAGFPGRFGAPLHILSEPARVASRLGRYIVAGARHILCRIVALDLTSQLDQLERIAELIGTPG